MQVGVLIITEVLLQRMSLVARSRPFSYVFPGQMQRWLIAYSREIGCAGCDATLGSAIFQSLAMNDTSCTKLIFKKKITHKMDRRVNMKL